MGLFEDTSITFGTINSYKDLGLIAKSMPFVALPEARLDLREVTGMSGKLDYTNVLDSKVRYKNRIGSWDFISINDYMETWKKVYSQLHGKVFYIQLAHESGYRYHGRVSVDKPSSNGYKTQITINYDLEPKRELAITDETIERFGLKPYKDAGQLDSDVINTGKFDWLWNDLFDIVIYYGTFSVKGSKWVNIVNPGDTPSVPTITVSADMQIIRDGKTERLIEGKNIDNSFELEAGDNVMQFIGTGTVNIDYTIGGEV